MQVNDLWNLLSCHGPHETVVIDATGLKIGRHGHIDVPLGEGVRFCVNPVPGMWDEWMARQMDLRVDL